VVCHNLSLTNSVVPLVGKGCGTLLYISYCLLLFLTAFGLRAATHYQYKGNGIL
jgi:hypothetical protein